MLYRPSNTLRAIQVPQQKQLCTCIYTAREPVPFDRRKIQRCATKLRSEGTPRRCACRPACYASCYGHGSGPPGQIQRTGPGCPGTVARKIVWHVRALFGSRRANPVARKRAATDGPRSLLLPLLRPPRPQAAVGAEPWPTSPPNVGRRRDSVQPAGAAQEGQGVSPQQSEEAYANSVATGPRTGH